MIGTITIDKDTFKLNSFKASWGFHGPDYREFYGTFKCSLRTKCNPQKLIQLQPFKIDIEYMTEEGIKRTFHIKDAIIDSATKYSIHFNPLTPPVLE